MGLRAASPVPGGRKSYQPPENEWCNRAMLMCKARVPIMTALGGEVRLRWTDKANFVGSRRSTTAGGAGTPSPRVSGRRCRWPWPVTSKAEVEALLGGSRRRTRLQLLLPDQVLMTSRGPPRGESSFAFKKFEQDIHDEGPP